MAPESLKSLEFSTASDVWSFGLTMWEIFTQGAVPFADLQSSQELFQFVCNGNFLPCPTYATEEMSVTIFRLSAVDMFAKGVFGFLHAFRMLSEKLFKYFVHFTATISNLDAGVGQSLSVRLFLKLKPSSGASQIVGGPALA